MRAVIVPLLLAASAFAVMTEDAMLELYGERVFRPSPGTLCLVTGQGDTLSFRNTGGETVYAEEFARYSLVDYLEGIDYWVIEAGGYEWVDWRLVNGETGESFTAISAPLPGPGRLKAPLLQGGHIRGFHTQRHTGLEGGRRRAGT
ncbi:MAG: hypothetical protein AVO35_09860 [Candidatus Aegiribacteria sp. MLS_C]|nr:MAG: hypothetical protein AVO35_09860 [Candidatus Aegiribacteria sp. MLS_C]